MDIDHNHRAFILAFHFYSIQQSFTIMAYAVREHDVAWRKEWIIRSTHVCPFNRVQNCSVQVFGYAARY